MIVSNVITQQKSLRHFVTTKYQSTTIFIIRVMNEFIWLKIQLGLVTTRSPSTKTSYLLVTSVITQKKTLQHSVTTEYQITTYIYYPCDECDHLTKTATALNYHKKSKHQNAVFNCD